MRIINLYDIDKNKYYLYGKPYFKLYSHPLKYNLIDVKNLNDEKNTKQYKIDNIYNNNGDITNNIGIYCYDKIYLMNKKNKIYDNNFNYNDIIIYNNFIKDLIDIIICYVYHFEKDKINKLIDIIKNNYLYILEYKETYDINNLGYKKYFEDIKYNYKPEICFNKNIFKDIFLLNLNCDFIFEFTYSNNISLYHELSFNKFIPDDCVSYDVFILNNGNKLINDPQKGYTLIKNNSQYEYKEEKIFNYFIINCKITNDFIHNNINFLIGNIDNIDNKILILNYIDNLKNKIYSLENIINNDMIDKDDKYKKEKDKKDEEDEDKYNKLINNKKIYVKCLDECFNDNDEDDINDIDITEFKDFYNFYNLKRITLGK